MTEYTRIDETYRGRDEATARALGGVLGLRAQPTAPLHADVSVIRLDTISAARLATGPIRLFWEDGVPEASQRFLFLFLESGVVELHGDSTRKVPDGAALCVIPPGRESTMIDVLTPARMIIFRFDRADLAPLAFDERELDHHPAASPIYHAAFSYLSGIALLPVQSDSLGVSALRELTCEIARSLVRTVTAHSRVAVTVHDRAIDLIEQAYGRPQLGVDEIARELGVSRRTLERAFEDSGESVAQVLQRTRSRHAVTALTQSAGRTLREIARACGFGSVDSLRRAIRAHHATSVALLRAESSGSPPARSAIRAPDAGVLCHDLAAD